MNDYQFVIDFFKKVGCIFVVFIILNIPNCFITYNLIINVIVVILSILIGLFIHSRFFLKDDEDTD